MQGGQPPPQVVYAKDRQKLEDEASKRIQNAGEILHDRAKDPLEKLWENDLAVPLMGTLEWRNFKVQVGGPGYGGF